MEETALTLTWDQVTAILAVIGVGALTFVLVTHSQIGPVIKKSALFAVQKRWPNDTPLWINLLILIGAVLWAFIFSLLLYNLVVHLIPDALLGATPQTSDDKNERRWLMVSLTALVATLGAVVALPFTLIKTRQNERQTKATEEGLITDRINSAVAGLGAEKTVDQIGRPVTVTDADGTESHAIEWRERSDLKGEITPKGEWQNFSQTKPNLEVRIGAILALERLARNNLDIHVQIMEILCAYIRENAPVDDAKQVAKLQIFEDEEGGLLREDWYKRLEVFKAQLGTDTAQLKPREDIQVALTVLGRRSADGRLQEARQNDSDSKAEFVFDTSFLDAVAQNEEGSINRDDLRTWQQALASYTGYRLDLRGANLQGADLANFNLRGARFHGTHMQGADLYRVHMQGADLSEARMQGADLSEAWMQGADLSEAHMQDTILLNTHMQGALLRDAHMQGAFLFKTYMQGANLNGAHMQGANLYRAHMQDATLYGAHMQGVNLYGAHMQSANLNRTQFDAVTALKATILTKSAVKAVDFKNVPQIAEYLQGMFGDLTTELADDMVRPTHWLPYESGWGDFDREWKKWKADPDNYVPPDPPPSGKDDD